MRIVRKTSSNLAAALIRVLVLLPPTAGLFKQSIISRSCPYSQNVEGCNQKIVVIFPKSWFRSKANHNNFTSAISSTEHFEPSSQKVSSVNMFLPNCLPLLAFEDVYRQHKYCKAYLLHNGRSKISETSERALRWTKIKPKLWNKHYSAWVYLIFFQQ